MQTRNGKSSSPVSNATSDDTPASELAEEMKQEEQKRSESDFSTARDGEACESSADGKTRDSEASKSSDGRKAEGEVDSGKQQRVKWTKEMLELLSKSVEEHVSSTYKASSSRGKGSSGKRQAWEVVVLILRNRFKDIPFTYGNCKSRFEAMLLDKSRRMQRLESEEKDHLIDSGFEEMQGWATAGKALPDGEEDDADPAAKSFIDVMLAEKAAVREKRSQSKMVAQAKKTYSENSSHFQMARMLDPSPRSKEYKRHESKSLERISHDRAVYRALKNGRAAPKRKHSDDDILKH